MKHCLDCGTRVYNGKCSNCHEEIFIEEQYLEQGMPIPKLIKEEAKEHRIKIKKKKELGFAPMSGMWD